MLVSRQGRVPRRTDISATWLEAAKSPGTSALDPFPKATRRTVPGDCQLHEKLGSPDPSVKASLWTRLWGTLGTVRCVLVDRGGHSCGQGMTVCLADGLNCHAAIHPLWTKCHRREIRPCTVASPHVSRRQLGEPVVAVGPRRVPPAVGRARSRRPVITAGPYRPVSARLVASVPRIGGPVIAVPLVFRRLGL